MDARLLAWARRVKRRRAPPLWLFTDAVRLPDPLPAIRRLPIGLAGVVLRHDGQPGRAALARAVARLCRARRLALSVAGDGRLAASLHAGAPGVGVHLRGGKLPPGLPPWLPRLTGSAHSPAEVARCRRAGVRLVFISPVFATSSHAGAPGVGALRWAAWTRMGVPAAGGGGAALGGIDGRTVRSLPGRCRAIGAIAALAEGRQKRCASATVFRNCHVEGLEMVASL